MGALNRYLLESKPTATSAEFEKSDKFVAWPGHPHMPYAWLRAGFEDALSKSRKPVVMLHPWPHGSNFETAATDSLPALAEGVIRLLWAEQRIGRGQAGIKIGRLGIAGYSYGGKAMWDAFKANSPHVSELYAFDADQTVANAPYAIQWFLLRSDNILRMSGAHEILHNQAIRQTILSKAPGSDSRVTSTPPDLRAYEKRGENPWWDHVLTRYPRLRELGTIRHQFALFGGYKAPPGTAVTFLQEFLEGSQF